MTLKELMFLKATSGGSTGFRPVWEFGKQAYKGSTASPVRDYIAMGNQSSSACGTATSGTYKMYGSNSERYPYPLPGWVKKVSITAEGFYIGMWFSDSTKSDYDPYASIVGEGNNASSSSGVADEHTYDVPEGADSFAMTVRLKSGASIQESDIENVSVTFLTE